MIFARYFRRSFIVQCAMLLTLAACDDQPIARETVMQDAENPPMMAQESPPAATPTAPRNAGTAPKPNKVIDPVKKEQTEIVLLLPDAKLPFHEFQRDGLAMLVGRERGYRLDSKDAANSAATQAAQFREAIAAAPAAIIVLPVDPAALAALIVEAHTAGITVIGLDPRMQNEGCTTVVYSDQKLTGRLAAQTVLEALRRKAAVEKRNEVTGRVVELRGREDSFASNEMAAGFAEALKAESGVVLVHDAATDWESEKTARRLEEAFKLQKTFDVIYAHNDAIALSAAKAAEAAGQRENILIVGTDGLAGQGESRGLELVRDAEIDATIVQPALVDLALQIVTKMHTDKTFKPQAAYEVKPVAVVPKNVDQCLRQGTYELPKL